MWWRVYSVNVTGRACLLALLFAMLTLAGCGWTESGYVRMAGDAGSTLAAAATTLRDAREARVTAAYARSSFAGYQQQLQGLEQQLPRQDGAPDQQTVQRLLALYRPAALAVAHPCLEGDCAWQAQVAALERASQAFQQAGNS